MKLEDLLEVAYACYIITLSFVVVSVFVTLAALFWTFVISPLWSFIGIL